MIVEGFMIGSMVFALLLLWKLIRFEKIRERGYHVETVPVSELRDDDKPQ